MTKGTSSVVKRRWTTFEVYKLYGYAETETMEQAARLLHRSLKSVKCKASNLGISFQEGRMTLVKVADLLEVDRGTISSRKKALGFTHRTFKSKGANANMRGLTGVEIVALARDLLSNDKGGRPIGTSAKRLREIILEYDGWEG